MAQDTKSPREIGLMREAGRIVAEAHALAARSIRPGMTTLELDRMLDEFIRENGGIPTFLGQYGFPRNVCISINEEVVHGIPGPRELREGDLASLDIGVTRRRWIGDSAWTHPVGKIPARSQRLLEAGEAALMAGLRQVRDGADLRDVSRAIQETAEAAGYSVVEEYTGHGVGQKLHEEPQVPNYVGPRHKRFVLRSGMTLAIEPMVNEGTKRVRQLNDNWTVVTKDKKLSVHFEHTVAVTPEGPLILTAPPGRSRMLMDGQAQEESK